MKQNPFEQLFNILKHLGHFKEYENYSAYKKDKYGEEETRQESFDKWFMVMPKKDQEDFKEAFNEE